MFIDNDYKQYQVEPMSVDTVRKVVICNSFEHDVGKGKDGKEISKDSIYGLQSFINHNKKTNVTHDMSSDHISFVRASRDIEEGE